MKKLKKNWQLVLIVVLSLFGLSKCTQSCNRDTKYNNAMIVVDSLENTIRIKTIENDSLMHVIDLLNKDIQMAEKENDNLKNTNKDLSDIAKKNQQIKVIKVEKD